MEKCSFLGKPRQQINHLGKTGTIVGFQDIYGDSVEMEGKMILFRVNLGSDHELLESLGHEDLLHLPLFFSF